MGQVRQLDRGELAVRNGNNADLADEVQIWFDGGYSGDQKERIQTLLQKAQPNAVIFGGCQDNGTCVSDNSSMILLCEISRIQELIFVVRWIGNELGHAEEENWST